MIPTSTTDSSQQPNYSTVSSSPGNPQNSSESRPKSPIRKKSMEMIRNTPYIEEPLQAHSTKKGPICQLPVTSSTGYKGRNRSTSTFSTASSASACYTFHHLNP